eukprot:CAMPEP_0178978074 /NCGR_PEP_ID=MMETSP0789-20121207/24917_1 /TAXON_ID=3005 /ORGANISM="Rhizosolenia setigera, Strain CCMP 1694" /LENGTH=715 /DNA_ID=CAMNT_0020667693 /DNA_START=22 /DNA_END=2169 /DNA_ORIENTATION=-
MSQTQRVSSIATILFFLITHDVAISFSFRHPQIRPSVVADKKHIKSYCGIDIHPSVAKKSALATASTRLFSTTEEQSQSSETIVSKSDDDEEEIDENDETKEEATAASSEIKAPWINKDKEFTRLRRLKDRMWVRETLEDLTGAEFACTIQASSAGRSSEDEESESSKKKRAVDFEALLTKLDRRVQEMCVSEETPSEDQTSCLNLERKDNSVTGGDAGTCYVLKANRGMSSVVYTPEQRESLLMRIMSTRSRLLVVMEGNTVSPSVDTISLDQIRTELQGQLSSVSTKDDDSGEKSSSDTIAADSGNATFPFIYVRDDGTVDWDGALQDREALKSFGINVWARINGQDPESVNDESVEKASGSGHGDSHSEDKKGIMAKIIETDEIRKLRGILDTCKSELNEKEKQHTALLNSAIPPTNTNPTVNLASLPPTKREEIKISTSDLNKKRDAVTFATLNYELERIFTYLEADLGNTFAKGYINIQDRLAVAEFGLLESQIASLNSQLKDQEKQNDVEIIDADVVQVIMSQLDDFKRRLGIDYYVSVNVTWDTETIKRYAMDVYKTSKTGLAFYVKGCKLLWTDLVFSATLLYRATLQGYTLKPREVRTLRRTIRDVITFIPFVIILIIPLSPVGHVLVFGAIQRFFPDFFPSMFTERRQNLLELYESTEYSEITINESFKEKFIRFSEASLLVTANQFKRLLQKVGETSDKNSDND